MAFQPSFVLLIAIAAGAFVQTTPSRPLPIRLSSAGTPFALQSDLEGECRLAPDALTVEIKKGAVVLRPGMTPRTLKSIRVGLARVSGERWEPAVWSDRLAVGRAMEPGDRITLAAHAFTIQLPQGADLKSHWLVVEAEEGYADGRSGSAYVQSARDLFARWR